MTLPDHDEAVARFLALVHDGDLQQAWTLRDVVADAQPCSDQLLAAFAKLFQSTVIDIRSLVEPWLRLVRRQPDIAALLNGEVRPDAAHRSLIEGKYDRLLLDPAWQACVSQILIPDPAWEQLLATMKRFLARSVAQEEVDAARYRPALAALCFHSILNGFETDKDAEIDAAIAVLSTRALAWANRRDGGGDGIEAVLAYGMFQPLANSPLAQIADVRRAAPELGAMIEESRFFRERRPRAPGHARLAARPRWSIDEVQAQYGAAPYPRWRYLPPAPVGASSYPHVLYPSRLDPSVFRDGFRVLVAGCGTGRHSLWLARQLPKSVVVAVDLSRPSLAYAQMMAARLAIDNIALLQGDLLNLPQEMGAFALIECVGVLHHLPRELPGLPKLASMLAPGGVIKIGVYSRLGRGPIVRAREKLSGLPPALLDDPLALKKRVLGSAETWCQDLSRCADFYNPDGREDLLFNPFESCFTMAELAAMVTGANLRLLGFVFSSPQPHRLYRQCFGADAAATSWTNWQALEEAHPDLFEGMYQLFCTTS